MAEGVIVDIYDSSTGKTKKVTKSKDGLYYSSGNIVKLTPTQKEKK